MYIQIPLISSREMITKSTTLYTQHSYHIVNCPVNVVFIFTYMYIIVVNRIFDNYTYSLCLFNELLEVSSYIYKNLLPCCHGCNSTGFNRVQCFPAKSSTYNVKGEYVSTISTLNICKMFIA